MSRDELGEASGFVNGLSEFRHLDRSDKVYYGEALMNDRFTGLECDLSVNRVQVRLSGEIVQSDVSLYRNRYLVNRTSALLTAKSVSHVSSMRLEITDRVVEDDEKLRNINDVAENVISELCRAEKECKRRGSLLMISSHNKCF